MLRKLLLPLSLLVIVAMLVGCAAQPAAAPAPAEQPAAEPAPNLHPRTCTRRSLHPPSLPLRLPAL